MGLNYISEAHQPKNNNILEFNWICLGNTTNPILPNKILKTILWWT